MNKFKIDAKLVNVVEMLDENKKIECIVKAFDFERTRNILTLRKIKILKEYKFISSFKVLMNKSQIVNFSSFSQVKFISSITKVSALMNISKKIMGIDNTTLTGQDINIAFIDTGIVCHSDFCLGENRIKIFKDFVDNKTKCYDDNGHGTFVCGVCCGNGALSAGMFGGIAPKANIISLKALDKSGESSAERILNAMEWIFDNKKKFGIDIVCMSFGSEPIGFNDPIMNGAEALWKEGTVVVAAAGNSGPEYQTIKSPGSSNKIITVGGFDDNRIDNFQFEKNFFEIADFSSRGPAFSKYKPDVIAPAVDIISCGNTTAYTKLSGTSVATPMIAGICALIKEKFPYLSPLEIKRRLLSFCKPITLNKNSEGFGYPIFNLN